MYSLIREGQRIVIAQAIAVEEVVIAGDGHALLEQAIRDRELEQGRVAPVAMVDLPCRRLVAESKLDQGLAGFVVGLEVRSAEAEREEAGRLADRFRRVADLGELLGRVELVHVRVGHGVAGDLVPRGPLLDEVLVRLCEFAGDEERARSLAGQEPWQRGDVGLDLDVESQENRTLPGLVVPQRPEEPRSRS